MEGDNPLRKTGMVGPSINPIIPSGVELDTPIPLVGVTPREFGEKILYYSQHPEETPPPTIKNMVKLMKLMKEDEETLQDEDGSGLFYSTDESVELSEFEESSETSELSEDSLELRSSASLEKPPRRVKKVHSSRTLGISSTSRGVRFHNTLLTRKYMQNIQSATVEDNMLYIVRPPCYDLEIVLPKTDDGNDVLKVLEAWLLKYQG